MADMYYCPGTTTVKCGLRFQVPTTAGKLCGLAPSIIATCAMIGVGLDIDLPGSDGGSF